MFEFALIVGGCALDQIAKILLWKCCSSGDDAAFDTRLFKPDLCAKSGAAFGILQNMQWLLAIVAPQLGLRYRDLLLIEQ
jgi:lipoprotein signal peptidase